MSSTTLVGRFVRDPPPKRLSAGVWEISPDYDFSATLEAVITGDADAVGRRTLILQPGTYTATEGVDFNVNVTLSLVAAVKGSIPTVIVQFSGIVHNEGVFVVDGIAIEELGTRDEDKPLVESKIGQSMIMGGSCTITRTSNGSALGVAGSFASFGKLEIIAQPSVDNAAIQIHPGALFTSSFLSVVGKCKTQGGDLLDLIEVMQPPGTAAAEVITTFRVQDLTLNGGPLACTNKDNNDDSNFVLIQIQSLMMRAAEVDYYSPVYLVEAPGGGNNVAIAASSYIGRITIIPNEGVIMDGTNHVIMVVKHDDRQAAPDTIDNYADLQVGNVSSYGDVAGMFNVNDNKIKTLTSLTPL